MRARNVNTKAPCQWFVCKYTTRNFPSRPTTTVYEPFLQHATLCYFI